MKQTDFSNYSQIFRRHHVLAEVHLLRILWYINLNIISSDYIVVHSLYMRIGDFNHGRRYHRHEYMIVSPCLFER